MQIKMRPLLQSIVFYSIVSLRNKRKPKSHKCYFPATYKDKETIPIFENIKQKKTIQEHCQEKIDLPVNFAESLSDKINKNRRKVNVLSILRHTATKCSVNSFFLPSFNLCQLARMFHCCTTTARKKYFLFPNVLER